jgi:hypothetical protein
MIHPSPIPSLGTDPIRDIAPMSQPGKAPTMNPYSATDLIRSMHNAYGLEEPTSVDSTSVRPRHWLARFIRRR